MNKLVADLDLQAKDYAAMELAESEQGGIARFNQLYRDKFAELIVCECAKAVDQRPSVLFDQTAGGFIKQHFGVEL